MVRFLFVSSEQRNEDGFVLDKRQAHRLFKVLRMRAGQRLTLRLPGSGEGFLSIVKKLDSRSGFLKIEKELGLPGGNTAAPFYLGVALLKRRKLEFIVQKATELGVTGVFLLRTSRTRTHSLGDNEFSRLLDIAREACQQCGRPLPPVLTGVLCLEELFRQCRVSVRVIFSADPESRVFSLSEARGFSTGSLLCLVGPEGGWSEDELVFCTKRGAVSRHIPGWTLRSETAACSVASLFSLLRSETGPC